MYEKSDGLGQIHPVASMAILHTANLFVVWRLESKWKSALGMNEPLQKINNSTPSTPTFAFPPGDVPLLSCLFVYPDSRWMVLVFLASNAIETTKQLLKVESYRPFPPSYGDGCRCPGSWSFDYKRCRRSSSLMCLRSIPSKFNIDPEKWQLENYFPFRKVAFQGLC